MPNTLNITEDAHVCASRISVVMMLNRTICTYCVVLMTVCVQGTAKPPQPLAETTNAVPAAGRSKGHTKKQLLVNFMPSLMLSITCYAS